MIAPLYNNALDGDVQMRQQWLAITNRYAYLQHCTAHTVHYVCIHFDIQIKTHVWIRYVHCTFPLSPMTLNYYHHVSSFLHLFLFLFSTFPVHFSSSSFHSSSFHSLHVSLLYLFLSLLYSERSRVILKLLRTLGAAQVRQIPE